ncbi:Protein of unknown function [Pyronema omphalodes CBS 100304]|uniref:Uncharacterized protein n=1 Tax=Pyronema omphalodes (strain CBS 100304) TaxID=1076935 RepID=U4LWA7_PYROM|nr:Protein of unknown function [Pyronema omphalodes CBS 100304]
MGLIGLPNCSQVLEWTRVAIKYGDELYKPHNVSRVSKNDAYRVNNLQKAVI